MYSSPPWRIRAAPRLVDHAITGESAVVCLAKAGQSWIAELVSELARSPVVIWCRARPYRPELLLRTLSGAVDARATLKYARRPSARIHPVELTRTSRQVSGNPPTTSGVGLRLLTR